MRGDGSFEVLAGEGIGFRSKEARNPVVEAASEFHRAAMGPPNVLGGSAGLASVWEAQEPTCGSTFEVLGQSFHGI